MSSGWTPLKRMPCPTLNAMPPFSFISHQNRTQNPKKKKTKGETKQNTKNPKLKEIWYHSAFVTNGKKGTRVFMCAASRDCEADLTILDTVLVFLFSFSPFAVRLSSALLTCSCQIQFSTQSRSQLQCQSPVFSLQPPVPASGQREVAGLCCCTF